MTLETRVPILVSLDENYLPQLRVMLVSLHLNNPGMICRIYLLHRSISAESISKLRKDLAKMGDTLCPIYVEKTLFAKAPVSSRYPQEMYYRLLAAQLLPPSLDKVLYLDPDILIINSIRPLWETKLGNNLFAAASHSGKTELISGVNNLRLGTSGSYFNSGVLLINLAQCRQNVHPEEIFQYVNDHKAELLLPDQDVLNALYGKQIRPLDDLIWNYDVRNYQEYRVATHGVATVGWVMEHTAILHFCGRDKPWKRHYNRRFGVLYRHYMQLAKRLLTNTSDNKA